MGRARFTINIGGKLLDLSSPKVMGILNVTPDSFYSASRSFTEKELARRADEIVEEGGAIIDIGAFSTRPGADEVSIQEEMDRLRRALAIVRRQHPDIPVSVDTFRPDVARMAVEEFGAVIINDVSGGGTTGIAGKSLPNEDDEIPEMFAMVARLRMPYVLTSLQPSINPMMRGLARQVNILRQLGVSDIIIDPGFGFGKQFDDNYRLMSQLGVLNHMELPLLVGVSRKSMITRLLNVETEAALNATSALHALALAQGVSILRVHDVREAVEVCRVVEKIRQTNDM